MKLKLLIAILSLTLALGGCAAQAAPADKEGAVSMNEAPTLNSEEAPVKEEAPKEEALAEETPEEAPVATGDVTLGGQGISICKPLPAETLTALGEPVETLEAPSCHFDGMDTIYYYDDFALYTYLDGDDSVVYLAELSTDKVETPEGVKISMSKEDVIATMGDTYEELGQLLSYPQGDFSVDFSFDENGAVSLIEYVSLQ